MSHHRKRLRQAPSLNTSFNCNVDCTLFSERSPSTLIQPFNLENGHLQKSDDKQIDQWMDISHIPVYTNIKINDNNKIYLNNNFLSQKQQKMKSLYSEQLGDRILQFDAKKSSNRLKNMHKKFTTTQNTTNKKESARRSRTKNLHMHMHKDIKQESRLREEESDKQNKEQQWIYHQKQAVINNLNLNNQIQPNITENILNFDCKNNKKLMKTKENKKKNIPFRTKNTRYTAEEYQNITLAKTINKCLDMNKLQERYQQLEKNFTSHQYQERPVVGGQKFNQGKQLFSQENELQHRIGLNMKTQTMQTPFISKGHSKASSLTIANIESINNELNLGLKIIDDSFQIETTEKQNFCYLDSIPYKNSFNFNVSNRACDRNQYRIHIDPQQIEDIILDQSIISPQCHKLTNELNKILHSQSRSKDEQIDLKIFKLTNPHTRTNTNSIVPPLNVERKQCDHYSFLESHQCECAELMNDDEECDLQIQLQKQQLIIVEYVGMLVHSFQYRLICQQNYATCCKIVEYLQTILQELSYPNILNIYRLKYRRMSPNFFSTKQKQLYIISEQQLYSSNLDVEADDKIEGKCTIYKQPVLVSDLYKKVYNMAQLMCEQQNINNCKTDRTYPMTNEKRHQKSADSIEKGEIKILMSWSMVQKLTKELIFSINYLNKVNLSQKFKNNQSDCLIGNLFTINLHMIYLCRIDFEKQGSAIQKYLYTFKIDVSDIEGMMQNHRNHYQLLLLQNLETIYSVIIFLCNQAQKVTDDEEKYQDTKYLCYNFLTQLENIIASGMDTNPTTFLQKLVIHPYIFQHVPTSYEKQFMSLLY